MSYFSYSQLAFYRRCPFRFFLERVKKVAVPLDERRHYLGTVLALVMEVFYTAQRWRVPQPLPLMAGDVQAQALVVDSMATLPWELGERARILAKATAMLPTMLDTVRREQLLGVRNYTEFDLETHIGRDTIVGRADLIIDSPAAAPGLWVIDGKAGGTLGRHVSTDQLRFYALCVLGHPLFNRLPDKLGFWWFQHGQVIWKKTSASALDKFRDGIAQTITSLRAKEFPTKPSADCRLCDVRSHCPDGLTYLRTQLAGQVPLDLPGNVGEVAL